MLPTKVLGGGRQNAEQVDLPRWKPNRPSRADPAKCSRAPCRSLATSNGPPWQRPRSHESSRSGPAASHGPMPSAGQARCRAARCAERISGTPSGDKTSRPSRDRSNRVSPQNFRSVTDSGRGRLWLGISSRLSLHCNCLRLAQAIRWPEKESAPCWTDAPVLSARRAPSDSDTSQT